MFRHVVLIELRPDAPDGRVEAIASALRALPAVVPQILSYEVNVDLGLAEGNAQLAVVAGFEDEAAWRTYLAHPEHQAVVTDLVNPVSRRRLALQAVVEEAGR